ncbi:TPA: hypothetical protein ACKROO_000561 [Pseudomonas aeruginosa]
MNKANECTCPSGDGSLVHPCPAHPAVEQAGGDERAAFEAAFAAMGRPVCRADYDQDAYGTPFDDGGWTGWQARAALAQPSPALPPFAEKVLAKLRRFYDCASDFESGGVDIGRHWLDLLTQLGLLNRVQRSPALWEISQHGEDLLGMPQPSPAQAKQAERPEVVGYRIMRAQADKIYQRVDKAAAEYEAGRSALGYMEDIAEAALCLRNRLDDLLAAPVAQAGQVPAAWYYDAPSQAEAAIIDIRGMWGEDDCPTYEDVASALRRLLATEPGTEVPKAWLDVQAERRRQVENEGWTPEHDDEHSYGQMGRAAACYALAGSSAPNDGTAALLVSLAWPWDEQWWKPSTARRDLVKACALALAEIERLDRATATQGGPRDA